MCDVENQNQTDTLPLARLVLLWETKRGSKITARYEVPAGYFMHFSRGATPSFPSRAIANIASRLWLFTSAFSERMFQKRETVIGHILPQPYPLQGGHIQDTSGMRMNRSSTEESAEWVCAVAVDTAELLSSADGATLLFNLVYATARHANHLVKASR